MHFLMIFLDGFGLGREKDNPIVAAKTPTFDALLGGHKLWGDGYIDRENVQMRPLDATLGVPGVPQSATGQTTLWTGVNAAKALGYHLRGYPNGPLKTIIKKNSIFKQLKDIGKKGTFANAYTENKIRTSASTLCALSGEVVLRTFADLLGQKAVYHDFTNALLQEQGFDIPLYTPYQSGVILGDITLENDFTLFEFFKSDMIGHKRKWDESVKIVEQIDEFLSGVLSRLECSGKKAAILLTSDHGNIEEFKISEHTKNPVPALGWSNFGLRWPEWKSLTDVTPNIVKMISEDGV